MPLQKSVIKTCLLRHCVSLAPLVKSWIHPWQGCFRKNREWGGYCNTMTIYWCYYWKKAAHVCFSAHLIYVSTCRGELTNYEDFESMHALSYFPTVHTSTVSHICPSIDCKLNSYHAWIKTLSTCMVRTQQFCLNSVIMHGYHHIVR